MTYNPVVQDARICQLERELRDMRFLTLCGMILGTTLALSGFRDGVDEVVRAERVELVGKEGLPQAILSSDTVGFGVTLLDERGRPAGSLRLSDEPRLSVETGRGREVAGLGAPKVHPLTE